MPSFEEYGHQEPIFPTPVDHTNAELPIDLDIRCRLYRIQQEIRLYEKRA